MTELVTLAGLHDVAKTGTLIAAVWLLAGIRHELRALVRRVDRLEIHVFKGKEN